MPVPIEKKLSGVTKIATVISPTKIPTVETERKRVMLVSPTKIPTVETERKRVLLGKPKEINRNEPFVVYRPASPQKEGTSFT